MKIFGIGLSRTGTTTLTDALKILGYDAVHDAPAIFPYLKEYVDDHDGFTDSQIAVNYKELDKLYPNSKFILTTRNVEDWLRSYENRLKYWKPIEKDWKKDVHLPLYGVEEYDKEKFKEGFFKHEKDVKEYFKDRPNDLMIMDFSKKVDWKELCDFLGKEIPSIKVEWSNEVRYYPPFPHQNKSSYLKEHPWKEKTVGFICLMHKCNDCSRNSFDIINRFIESLYKHCWSKFNLYLFDNGSDEKYNVPPYTNLIYTKIEDQTIRGLAGPYNDGIKMAVEDGCDLIILINDDIIVNPTINQFIGIVRGHPHRDIGVYGPLSNGLHKKSHQLAQKKGKGIREITNEPDLYKNINGFLMAFTTEFYHKVKLDNGDFCDMRKKWGGGEEVMQNRARERGCRMFIVKDCWVYHRRFSEWNKFEKWSRLTPK